VAHSDLQMDIDPLTSVTLFDVNLYKLQIEQEHGRQNLNDC